MNSYEGMFIIDPQLSEEDLAKVIESIQAEITKNDGNIDEVEHIGRQHMAYAIKKLMEGYYLLIKFSGKGSLIGKIKSKYRINDNILRSLLLKKAELTSSEV